MAKIVYNNCYGGFGLSEKAINLARELSGDEQWNCNSYDYDEIKRHDKTLVRVVEMLGKEANSSCANLCIKEVPDGTVYRIDEYDGNETVIIHGMDDWSIAE